MKALLGHPALRRLARMKFRAYLRSFRRRLSTPSGVVFGLIGLLVMALWIGSVAFRSNFTSPLDFTPDERRALVKGGLLMLTLVSVTGSLGHRGLYLPKDEVERLLSAPVSRSDLVRYRLLSNLVRTLLFAVIIGVIVAPRMPVRVFAFAGCLVAVLTLPMVGQASALLFGDAENRLGRIMKRVPTGALRIVTGVLTWTFLMLVLFGGDMFHSANGGSGMSPWKILSHPVFETLTLPYAPWANAITATDLADFLPWFLLCALFWVLSFEATARIPVDFRALSLQTSADVARRLSRLRSGRNAISGGKVSQRALGWRVPWLFGRGPFGAIAWLKLCSIVRKSRGTLIFSVVVIGFMTFITTMPAAGPMRETLAGSLLVAILGTIYLSAGLRFDFRSDLDLMETIKAWPLAPWRIFLATILPEVVLVTLLIALAIFVRAAIISEFPPILWVILGCVPGIALIWTALDNAVFLFAPVRFVPGQGGAMHHTGRAMVLVLLRMALLVVVILLITLAALLVAWLCERLALPAALRIGLTVGAGMVVLGAATWTLIQLGGWTLERFDVSRERTMTQ